SRAGNLANSTVQLLSAGILSAIVAGFTGEWPALFTTGIPATAWAGLAYLIIMGSLVAYLSFNWLITVQPPAIVSTHTYVNPVIAVAMGWLLVSEPVSGRQLAALGVVLIGVLMTQLNKPHGR
ncbi:MAG: EamA family transporter, partial [Chitinophagaceae bacterium]|nr:EamA family transporter [Chitinophagaceae bacterium]